MSDVIQLQFDFDQKSDNTQIIKQKEPSKRDKDKFVFEFMDMLTAPIITFTTSWEILDRLKQDITQARLISGMMKEEMASIPEIVAYIMTRTYESPMHSEWVNIYTWCDAQYMKQYRNVDVDLDITPESLTDYEQSLLKQLRIWIYDKRRKYVKQKLKT